jgi:hypothetical protein
MKNIYLLPIIVTTIFSTVAVSCSDDFVDRPIEYSIDSENYFNSKMNYDNALAYDLLQTTLMHY